MSKSGAIIVSNVASLLKLLGAVSLKEILKMYAPPPMKNISYLYKFRGGGGEFVAALGPNIIGFADIWYSLTAWLWNI